MNQFDRIAPWYDWLADLFFGSTLLESQVHHFRFIPEGSRILVAGGGTGRLLPYLLGRNPSQIVFIDASARMISRARKQVGASNTVRLVQNDILDVPIEGRFDVIVTPYFLDVFTNQNVSKVMGKLADAMTEDGNWIFADFQYSGSLHRIWQIPLIKMMYLFFRATCNLEAGRLPDFTRHFSRLGLTPVKGVTFNQGLMVSRVYQFAKDS